ncbi:MAG TPA: site-specific integrase [Gemmataceae bacterium]|nr:site-specific integrase [Gemmataceae bacterium]
MPTKNAVPTYRKHKQSGQAVVTLPDGFGGRRDTLLGKFGSKQSRMEYARVVHEWEAAGRRLPHVATAACLSVNEMILAYDKHAEKYYVKDGKPTSEIHVIRQAMRFVKRLYGRTPANDFGPRSLKAVRQAMIDHPIVCKVKVRDPETGEIRIETKLLRQGMTRRCINKQIGRIKRLFAWAVEEEMVPVAVHQTLLRVKGLKRGQSSARENPRIKPVPDRFIEAVLPHLPATVATMVQVQRLCGGRPQDVVEMRAIDIEVSGPVWEYRPHRYKTEHHKKDSAPDQERIVFLGPRAQALLKPYLSLSVTDYLFAPANSEEVRNGKRRENRKSPMTPSQAKRKRKANRLHPWGPRYDVATYRRAIARACLKAGVPVWKPNQLRHSRGTEIRRQYGLEAAQAVLGHAELGVTQVYAEADREAAQRIMGEIG